MNFIEKIESCNGTDSCWGILNKKHPIAICTGRNVDVMIITEQMPTKMNEVPDKPNKLTKRLIENLKNAKKGKGLQKNTASWGINDILNGKFLEDFNAEKKCFNRFYWTHYIKCPGNLRNKNFNKEGLKEDSCAEKWLMEEIKKLNPDFLIVFGAKAATWFLRKVGINKKWQVWLWEEIIEPMIKNNEFKIPEVEICNKKRKFLIAYHPSGLNFIGRIINGKIKAKLKTENLK